MRVRVRRKRKKHGGQRGRTEFTQLLIRWLVKFWILFVFLPAAALLIYEATRTGRKPALAVNSEVNEVKKPNSLGNKEPRAKVKALSQANKSESTLNRLDPTTHVVGGVRELCLKLLPAEELEHLELPLNEESSNNLVKRLVYISDQDTTFREGKSTLPWQRVNDTRFNLFTGSQTIDEREESFEVNETAVIHCGFYSENGGFKVSDEDKVCYVAFWDEITLAAQDSQGHKIGEDGFIGKWRIVVVKNLPFVDQRLNGKIPKMLPHRLFPHAKYCIWVDSKSQFRRDPLGVIEALLLRTNSLLAISEHGACSSVYDEAEAVVKKHKATPEEVEVQMRQYHKDGLPEDKRFNGKKGSARHHINYDVYVYQSFYC
ncbi:hypothetical protein V6N13_059083 [Hibiscus sabdariffa]